MMDSQRNHGRGVGIPHVDGVDDCNDRRLELHFQFGCERRDGRQPNSISRKISGSGRACGSGGGQSCHSLTAVM